MHPTLATLLSLLTTAVIDLDKLYESSDIPIPSLDKPSPQSDSLLRDNPEGLKASKAIVAVCDQLINLVQAPEENVRQAAIAFTRTSCIQTILEANIPEILREFGGNNGLHVDRIAAISGGADASKLGRVLRFLATFHIFTETSPDMFANNRNSSALDTGRAVAELVEDPANRYTGTGQVAAMCLHNAAVMMPTAVHMSEIIRRPKEKYSATPHNKFVKSDASFFEWIQLPENALTLKRFNFGMGVQRATALPFDGFQWSKLATGAHVVDVGGGMGFATLTLAKAFPSLKFTIEDLPDTIEASRKHFAREAPEVLALNVTHQVHNFFDEQPIQGADVYFMRAIMHDWPDEAAIDILSRLRAAATETSRLVCVDKIVDYACPGGSLPTNGAGPDILLAPAPLLSNWGAGAAYVYSLDMIMLMHFGDAKERTLPQWKYIFEEAGWKLTQVYRGSLSQCVGEPM